MNEAIEPQEEIVLLPVADAKDQNYTMLVMGIALIQMVLLPIGVFLIAKFIHFGVAMAFFFLSITWIISSGAWIESLLYQRTGKTCWQNIVFAIATTVVGLLALSGSLYLSLYFGFKTSFGEGT